MPLPDLSEKEREIIARFAKNIRETASVMMLIRDALGPGRIDDVEAFNSLIARGWVITSGAVHWKPDYHCMICGEGLQLAQEMRPD